MVTVGVGIAAYFLSQPATVGDRTSEKTEEIQIDTTPDKASIKVDGKELRKKTDTSVRATVGTHTVVLSLEGYDTQEVMVLLEAGKPYKLEHVFTKQGQTVLPTPKPGQAQFVTYTNPKFGYSVQYPSAWSADTDPSGVAHFYNDAATKRRKESPGAETEEALAILVYPNPRNLDPAGWYRAREEYPQEDQNQISQRSLTVAGQPAYQYETPYGFVPYLNTVITGKGNAYLFQQKQGSPDRKIYDQILESFKLN